MTSTVGFIGLGHMGRPMAANLVRKGFEVVVYNRSREPVDALVALGAAADGSPSAVARRSDVIITMLPDTADVREVVAGPHGVFADLHRDGVVVDMSTIDAAAARELSATATARSLHFLDAPVSGGEIGAVDGTLSIMVGGDKAIFDRVRPLLAAMGRPERILWIGDSGAGQVAKACNQLLIGATLVAMGEVFAIARKASLDPAAIREALLGGFAASRVLEVHGARVLSRDYAPGFPSRLFTKDLRIVASLAETLGVPLPLSTEVMRLQHAHVSAGRGEDDYSSLADVVTAMAGTS